MSKTAIEWASHSWNPYTWKCVKVSAGCQQCYMMSLAKHWRGRAYNPVGSPELREVAWRELTTFPAGSVIFINSMSDTYHESARQAWIHKIHNTARQYDELIFLALTKRIERAAALAPYLDWPPNLWIGTSVETSDYLWRLHYLRQIPAAGHFVSFEPLLGSVRGVWLEGIDWVLVGGESGPHRRKFDRQWAREIRDSCRRHAIPFFFKQGSAGAPGKDRLLDSHIWEEMPPQIERALALQGRAAAEQAGGESQQDPAPTQDQPVQLSLFEVDHV